MCGCWCGWYCGCGCVCHVSRCYMILCGTRVQVYVSVCELHTYLCICGQVFVGNGHIVFLTVMTVELP